jgi:copper homeostasis protein
MMNHEPLKMSRSVLLEICANSVTSAIAAQNGGATRIELCENLNEGGTTPSYGAILQARKLINIKVYVLIRPRSGDFLYTDPEYEIMLTDAKFCLEAGCDGIVTGLLNADGTIDKKRSSAFINLAKQYGAGSTFHRAFDRCNDQFKALEDIIEMGFERILTSGDKSTAIEGARRIAELNKAAAGRIVLMPGGGITENNVGDIVEFTGVTEVHSSARVRMQSQMIYKNDHIIMSDNSDDEYTIDVTDVQRVKDIHKNAIGYTSA